MSQNPESAIFWPPGWQKRLTGEVEQEYFQALMRFVARERASAGPSESGLLVDASVYPAQEQVFRAFRDTDFDRVRVVVLGQDPYHGPGQAIGRAFAVDRGLKKKPPSLLNIFKEASGDHAARFRPEWDSELESWVRGGVFLLNTVLTVRAGEPLSHRNQGWERFTDRVMEALNARPEPIIFLLWGAPAQKKRELITGKQHVVLEAPHPSPLSAYRGFLGCGHFVRCNEILRERGEPEIEWVSLR